MQYIQNKHQQEYVCDYLTKEDMNDVVKFHQSLEFYNETPLVSLNLIAKQLNIGKIVVKDESKRFGLKAFKGLGGTYALYRVLCDRFDLDYKTYGIDKLKTNYQNELAKLHIATATDGNHGKGVAFAANYFGCISSVYMPKGSLESRRQAIIDVGASECIITEFGYDDTVRLVSKKAQEEGWIVVQDTSSTNYETIPMYIIQGYLTMLYEALKELKTYPTHIFVQAGVGSMAGAIIGCIKQLSPQTKCFVVESKEAACIYESMEYSDGKCHRATGNEQTIMAGLNCSETCEVIWPVLKYLSTGAFACEDDITIQGIKAYKKEGIESGESGAVTLGVLLAMDEQTRSAIQLDEQSIVLLFNTEGNTSLVDYE